MASRQGGTLSGFTPLSTPNAPTDLSVSTSIGSAEVSFTAPTDTGDGAVTSYIVTAIDESTGASAGATGSASPITVSPGGGTFKIRAQAVNGFGPGRLTEFVTGQGIFSGAELYAWGDNSPNGQLGDGTVVDKSSPIQVGSLTSWLHVSSAVNFSTAIKTDGTLWSWGSNYRGKLGVNNTIDRSSPVQVGALTDWATVSSQSSAFSVAIRESGGLYAWGYNTNGQLGQNDTNARSSPTQVGVLSDWSQVSAGIDSFHAIKTNNTLWGCGRNNTGRVGDGTVVYRSSPVQIGALSNWSQVSSGSHCIALKTDGSIWTWGSNLTGQLGDNTTVSKSSPIQVGSLLEWAYVASGSYVSLAIKTTGSLWAWGGNDSGELGDGTTVRRSSPIQVGALTNWGSASSGSQGCLAIKTDTTLWSWGDNVDGVLGLSLPTTNAGKRSSPVQIGALSNWFSSERGGHALATLAVP
jgi:alpha-tubulin suppressor-like RCC1 family protein